MTGVLLALTAACSWAATAICVRKGLRDFDPALGTFISLVVGAVVVWTVVLATPLRHEVVPAVPLVGWFALLSVLQFPLGRYGIYRCISIVGVPLGTAIHATSPLFATLFAVGVLGERLSVARAGGVLLVVTGLAAMTLERRSVEQLARRLAPAPGGAGGAPPLAAGRLRAGVAFGVLGAGAYGLTQVGARGLASIGAHPMMTTAFTLAFGCLWMALLARRSLATIARVDRGQVVWLAAAGLFAASGALSLFSALNVAPVTLVSPVAAINPLIAMLIARFALRDVDVISRRMVGRAAVVVTGIALVVAA